MSAHCEDCRRLAKAVLQMLDNGLYVDRDQNVLPIFWHTAWQTIAEMAEGGRVMSCPNCVTKKHVIYQCRECYTEYPVSDADLVAACRARGIPAILPDAPEVVAVAKARAELEYVKANKATVGVDVWKDAEIEYNVAQMCLSRAVCRAAGVMGDSNG